VKASADARNESCTNRAIAYNVFGIAGLIANLVKRHARGDEMSREVIFDFVTLSLLARDWEG
jgi:hypothetical protein